MFNLNYDHPIERPVSQYKAPARRNPTVQTEILKILNTHPGRAYTAMQLRDLTGKKEDSIRSAMYRLTQENRVERLKVNNNNSAKPHVWAIRVNADG